MNFVVNTGSQQQDHEELNRYQKHYRAQGLELYAQPLPTGGYQVTIAPPQGAPAQAAPAPAAPPPQQYGAPQAGYSAPQAAPPQQQYGAPQGYGAPQAPAGYGAPQAPAPQYGAPVGPPPGPPPGAPPGPPAGYGAQPQGGPGYGGGGYGASPGQASSYAASASSGGGGPSPVGASYAMGGGAAAAPAAGAIAPPLTAQRVVYLRKVYGLLGVAAFLAVFSGWAALNFGPTVTMTSPEGITVEVPLLASLMLGSSAMSLAAFGILFVATLGASAVSKVPVLNVIALNVVAIIMGVELSDMVFVAQFSAGLGETLSGNPVRDAMVMVMSVFVGITAYIFITRKDFSWMRSIFSMGFAVVFGACLLTFVFHSPVFSLAVASTGAVVAIIGLLYVTSYIFRNSQMDDAVGDALALLVQLRNLFMFILRILMSARR